MALHRAFVDLLIVHSQSESAAERLNPRRNDGVTKGGWKLIKILDAPPVTKHILIKPGMQTKGRELGHQTLQRPEIGKRQHQRSAGPQGIGQIVQGGRGVVQVLDHIPANDEIETRRGPAMGLQIPLDFL